MNYNHDIIIKNKNNSPHILTYPIFKKKIESTQSRYTSKKFDIKFPRTESVKSSTKPNFTNASCLDVERNATGLLTAASKPIHHDVTLECHIRHFYVTMKGDVRDRYL